MLSLHACNTQLKEVDEASGRESFQTFETQNAFKLGRETIKLKESNKPITKMLSTLPTTTNYRKLSGDEFDAFAYNDTENNSQTD